MPTQEEIAQSYAWELSVINSIPDLKRLFHTASKQGWTREKFQAEVRDTKWYRAHAESWRRMYLMEHGVDPAQYKKLHHDQWQRMRDIAQQMGAVISSRLMARMSKSALYNNWSDGEIRDKIAHYVKFVGGRPFGEAATTTMQLRHTANANGYTATTSQLQQWAKQVAAGVSTVDSLQNWIRAQTAKSFGSFSNELAAGTDLADIAAPYTQAMATLWEQNPAEITMFNPYIRQALSRKSPKTGEPWAMSTADFEDLLRKNPRWLSTQNAQDTSMGVVHGILQRMHAIAA